MDASSEDVYPPEESTRGPPPEGRWKDASIRACRQPATHASPPPRAWTGECTTCVASVDPSPPANTMTDQRRMRPPCITFLCRGAPFTAPSAPFTPPAAPWLPGGATAGKPRGKPPPTADPSSGAGRLNVHPIRGTPKRSLSAPIARRCAWCRSADANLWSQLPKRTPNCEHRRKRRASTGEGGNRSHSNHQRA